MAALVEAHDSSEASAALESGAGLIGINNRDLSTFDVKMSATGEAAEVIRDKAVLVSESGMDSADAVQAAASSGARAVLIGTAFCLRPDPGAAVKEIMGW
jgi:indole-3-glycerol phosphate synthase